MSAVLLAAGAINTDLVATMERAPDAGETITARSFATFGGGKGANQAVSAVRNGVDVVMLGGLGEDANGTARRADLEAEGIVTGSIYCDPVAASGVALIFVETSGENRIAYVPGVTTCIPVEHCQHVYEQARPGTILATNELPQDCLVALFRLARRDEATVIFNATPDPELSLSLLHDVSMLIVNEGELRAILGLDGTRAIEQEHLQEVQVLGPAAVIVTLGSRGAVALAKDGELHEVSPPPVQPVDTTGAGDAFCGAFAASIARGEPVPVALRYGVHAGSIATMIPGAQPSSPTRAAIEATFPE